MKPAPFFLACGIVLAIFGSSGAGWLPAQAGGSAPRITRICWLSTHLVVRGECECGPIEIRKLPGLEVLCQSPCVGGRFVCRIPDTEIQPGDSIFAYCPGGFVSYPMMVREPNEIEMRFRTAALPAPPVETIYFDIIAGPGFNAAGLDLLLLPGNWVIRVFTVWNGGSHVGRENSPTAWTPIGEAPVNSNGPDEPTPFPVFFDVPLIPNQPRGFAVEVAGGPALLPESAPVGSTGGEAPGIRMITGTTGGGSFTGATGTGKLIGGFWYQPPTPAPIPSFEVQPYAASLDIDGLHTSGLTPAVTIPGGSGGTVGSTPAPEVLHADFAVPLMPFDLGVAIAPLVHGVFPATPGGQVVNLDVLSPTLFFLNSGTGVPNLQPNPVMFFIPLGGGPVTTVLPTISAQMFVIEPGHADGLVLTQGVQYGS